MAEQPYPINFFEIPVTDFDRAKSFYEAVTGSSLDTMEMGPIKFGMFPRGEYVGGAIVKGEGYTPSKTGSLVYLNGRGDIEGMLARVEKAGGKVVVPRTSLGQNGAMAKFEDCEGNLVAIHSM